MAKIHTNIWKLSPTMQTVVKSSQCQLGCLKCQVSPWDLAASMPPLKFFGGPWRSRSDTISWTESEHQCYGPYGDIVLWSLHRKRMLTVTFQFWLFLVEINDFSFLTARTLFYFLNLKFCEIQLLAVLIQVWSEWNWSELDLFKRKTCSRRMDRWKKNFEFLPNRKLTGLSEPARRKLISTLK